jgi:phage baseplate assembly protein W
MAFGAKKIFPIDQRPGTAVGISIPFNAPNVFSSTYTTKDAIRNNLLNFFLTNTDERYLNPNFGSNLRSKLFEQMEQQNIDGLQQAIQDAIAKYFSNINVEQLDITPVFDSNELFTNITYSIIDTGIVDNIQIELI